MTPVRLIGVDFSGARDAGKHIWIAEGSVRRGSLTLEQCRTAAALPNGGAARDAALGALRDHIVSNGKGNGVAVYGFDFPFTLPRTLMGDETWTDFVLTFGDRFGDPSAFRSWCRAHDGGTEQKRRTEREARVPFSAYNLRLYRQTYYGIRDLLAPLVRRGAVWVVPMQDPDRTRPWLMETCPASALKRLGLYRPYKGTDPSRRRSRETIVSALLAREEIRLSDPTLREIMIEDAGGDALDSTIAAAIVLWNHAEPIPEDLIHPQEGYVYR